MNDYVSIDIVYNSSDRNIIVTILARHVIITEYTIKYIRYQFSVYVRYQFSVQRLVNITNGSIQKHAFIACDRISLNILVDMYENKTMKG